MLHFVHRRSPRSTWHVERWEEEQDCVMYKFILYSPVVKSLLGLKKLPESFDVTTQLVRLPSIRRILKIVAIGSDTNKIDGLFGQKMYGEGWLNVRCDHPPYDLLLLSVEMIREFGGIPIRLGSQFQLEFYNISYERTNMREDHKRIKEEACRATCQQTSTK